MDGGTASHGGETETQGVCMVCLIVYRDTRVHVHVPMYDMHVVCSFVLYVSLRLS